ncbi:MAG: hypothetical protein JG777_1030 [Clostridia bacterium]|jgi:uncharacterized protein YrzB (UPF0473 family)|uniref:DUF1292 domain-containing protein n=1 Tax=Petroclostridium xylanilyticum TaxID=1792311 RepID=UPI000B98324E|nr:DUF1292 domain-containing protein [Petroclostridium xylanilyticum]MBZ4645541.1 hypothetical protein [Clostridia bacterium]
MTEEREDIVVLVDENGEEVEFEHLDTIEMNDSKYVVLLPLEEEGEEDEVVILKVAEDENGEDSLIAVEDEDELNEVFEEFKLRMEDEFDFVDDEDYEDEEE